MLNNDSKLPWGISLLIIGVLYLFRKMNIFSYAVEDFIFDWRNLLILLGVVFLLLQKKQRTGGIVLIAVGICFYLTELISWDRIADFIWPLILITVGGTLVYTAIIKNKSQQKEHNFAEENKSTDKKSTSTIKNIRENSEV